MKVSKNFDIREFVPPEIWEQYGEDSVQFIDERIPVIVEKIRELCGNRPVTLNNWHIGGEYKYRGYRPASYPFCAKKSQHKEKKAADLTVKGLTAAQVRKIIRDNQEELMALGLRRMEKDVTWVHIDLKETGLNYIYEFKP